MLRRLGRSTEAKESHDAAIAATRNSAERAYLREGRAPFFPTIREAIDAFRRTARS